jgi:indole-3-glycerol phosphate synthase
VRREAEARRDTRGFAAALRAKVAAGQAAVIAEVKKASPSKGVLRDPSIPRHRGRYAAHGAACLSVLTDERFFQGAGYLQQARAPVRCRCCARTSWSTSTRWSRPAIGADCILLIAACLDDAQMADLEATAMGLGMDVLVEVHDGEELERACA